MTMTYSADAPPPPRDTASSSVSVMTGPSQRRPQPPGFQCGEYWGEISRSSNGTSRSSTDGGGGPSSIFFCTLPSIDDTYDESKQPTTSPQRLTFACRNRSVGILETNEINNNNKANANDDDYNNNVVEEEEEDEEEPAGDPNFFDTGYTLAGRTGFQVWAATRIVLEALLFPLPDHDCERLQAIQRDLFASSSVLGNQNNPKKILELGAGVGVVSMSVAAATGSHVLLSDLPTLVAHSLLPNLKRNATTTTTTTTTFTERLHDDNSNGRVPPEWLCTASQSVEVEEVDDDEDDDDDRLVFSLGNLGGWASVCFIDWTKPLSSHVASIATELDYIIASDCVWLKSMLDALFDTVESIFQLNDSATLLLSFQRRDSSSNSNLFTRIDSIVESVKERGWSLDCLAWRYATVEGDTEPKEVFLLEIKP